MTGAGLRQAEILTVGNEIISGFIQDTNARKLAARLNEIGVWVSRITAVGDDPAVIQAEVKAALDRAQVLIMTGGLGATHDDITKQVLADLFQSPLRVDARVRDMILAFFRRRGKEASPLALRQSEVPTAATVLYNDAGTAPGLLFHRGDRRVYALPGVPAEMEHLLEKYLAPGLAAMGDAKVLHRVLNTTGLAESALWEITGPVDDLDLGVGVASLPSHLGVRIRLTVIGAAGSEGARRLDAAEARLREKLGRFIYSRDDESLEQVVGRMLLQRGWTLAVAESCTGGLVSSRVTRVAGISASFLEGAVTYSNAAKIRRLGVNEDLLQTQGAVSEPVARAMAEGLRQGTGADFTIAVTGIAGPDGGSAAKPVGLTFIAVTSPKGTQCASFQLAQDRWRNQERAAQAALNLLRLRILEMENGSVDRDSQGQGRLLK